jgi:hypothetical protein
LGGAEQVAVEFLHEFGGTGVLDFPEAGDDGGTAGVHEAVGKAVNAFGARGVVAALVEASGIAGAEDDEFGAVESAPPVFDEVL